MHYIILHTSTSTGISDLVPLCKFAVDAEIQDACVQQVKQSHPELTDDEAYEVLQQQAPREYFVSRHDINNITLKLARESYRKDESDVRSVQLLLDKHKSKVSLRLSAWSHRMLLHHWQHTPYHHELDSSNNSMAARQLGILLSMHGKCG